MSGKSPVITVKVSKVNVSFFFFFLPYSYSGDHSKMVFLDHQSKSRVSRPRTEDADS